MGKIIRGTSKNARFFIVDSTDVVQKGLDIHKCTPTAIDDFGMLLTAGLIMGASLKGEDMLTIKTDTDGPLKSMLVTADAKGDVKGYVSDPNATIPLTENNKRDVSGLLGKGTLRIIRDMGLKEPYVGVSEMKTGSIAKDLAYYYYTSEQIPTVLALGVDLKDASTIKKAGGYMIQLLPGADENFITLLEQKIKAIKSITDLLSGMDLETIARLLYDDMNDTGNKVVEDYEILEEKEVKYGCNCNHDRFLKGLITLGKDELNKIFKENSSLEVKCQFCNKKYQYTKDEFRDILGEE